MDVTNAGDSDVGRERTLRPGRLMVRSTLDMEPVVSKRTPRTQ